MNLSGLELARKKSNVLHDQRASFHGHDKDDLRWPNCCNHILFLLHWVPRLRRSTRISTIRHISADGSHHIPGLLLVEKDTSD